MAINPSALAEFVGRITAPNGAYPYGSSKDESASGAGDGTPYLKIRADDLFGFQQALLRAGGLVPSGDAETALESQYLAGIIQQVLGRSSLYEDTGAANAYVVALRANQQAPGALFDGMTFKLIADNANTGIAATIDVSALINEAPGNTVLNIKLRGGVANPPAGLVIAGFETEFIYRTSPTPHAELRLSNATIGLGQTWQNVTGSRAASTNYTNSTGRPIMVNVFSNQAVDGANLIVDGVTVATNNAEPAVAMTASAIVPPGSVYSYSAAFAAWSELR